MVEASFGSLRMRGLDSVGRFHTVLFAIAVVTALGAAPAQAQFTGIYGFGDSYDDTGTAPGGAFRLIGIPCPYSPSCAFTGSTTFVQSLQSIYGLPGMVNYAIGGARTDNTNTLSPIATGYGFAYELQQAAGRRFSESDLIALSIGGNDLSAVSLAGLTTDAQKNAQLIESATQSASNAAAGVQQLVNSGARTFAWLSTGYTKWFPEPPGSAGLTDAQRDLWADTYYQQTQQMLVPLARSGVRIFLFDFGILQQRVRDNPGLYGFSGAINCEAGPASGSTPAGIATGVAGCFYENSVHPTGAAMALIASYMANQISAPSTVAPQAGIATGLLTGFTNSVFERLDASRRFQPFSLGAAMAAMPVKAMPADAADRWSVFGDVGYAGSSRDRQFYAAGYDYSAPGGSLGAEYRLDSHWRLGGVFGYSQPDVKLGIQDARNRIDAFQFAGYSSYADAHWFGDAILAYGHHALSLERRGIIDVIRADTAADVFTVAAKGGYLFDAGRLRIGPIAALQYTSATIKGYTEAGDVLLTMMVNRQTQDALTGDAGIQLRYPLQWGEGVYTPFVNLTAAHDFLGGHTLITTLVTAPLLPVLTPVSVDGATYGKVAAGVSAAVAGNVSATLTGTSSFARHSGNDAGVSGGLKVTF